MAKTRIIVGHGLKFFGQPSPLVKHIEPLLDALGHEFGAEKDSETGQNFTALDWNFGYGFLPFAGIDRIIAVTHSYFCCRFAIDMRRLAGNFEFESVLWYPIDSVLFTTEDNPDAFSSSWGAQLQGKKLLVPGNISYTHGFHRQLPFPRVAPFESS
jgi:hypothetical protein